MFIRTDRLFLRPAFPEDWQALHDRLDDEGIVRNLARAPWPYRAEDAQAFAKRAQDPWRPGFVITMPGLDGSHMVGQIGLGEDGDDTQIGYWIARPYWGQGIASEAGAAVLEVARMLGHKRLVAGHFTDNPESGRVLSKLGFRSTGEIRMDFSCGRGTKAPAMRYEMQLGEDSEESDVMRAAQTPRALLRMRPHTCRAERVVLPLAF